MEKIIVTGGCGFIGSNFIRHLLYESAFSGSIINIDKMTYAANADNLKDAASDFPDRYSFVCADICDNAAMENLIQTSSADSICHFAAESHVDRSIADPEAFIRTNIMGTYRLLEIARKHPDRISLFHHVSTDEVFGSLGAVGAFAETTPYDPSSPYSASKAASDHLVSAYHRTYGIPVTISNCSNNYGPYQFPEKLIPLVILNAKEGRPIPVYGDGKNIRDWLHVADHCRAIWTVMNKGIRGRTYNIGGNAEMRNIDVVTMICDAVDRMAGPLDGNRPRRNLIRFVTDRPGHDRRYAMDCSRIGRELGWKPKESFETGLEKTVRWYLENEEWVERVKSGEYLSWMKQQYGD
ncbi:MAG: dTDP-glucose 4,6-dehydratase [Deltaproteobacteria bacterium]|nr:dTDP-glucose 4,6-dehydratase [Deltaproteobacteria bacterium]